MANRQLVLFNIIIMAIFANCSKINVYAQDNELFKKQDQTLGETRSFIMAHGDLDGNGYQDIILANFLGQSQIWFNNGISNSFSSQTLQSNYGTDHGVAIGDLNENGFLDIYLVATSDKNGKNMIFINDGKGSFTKKAGLFGNEKVDYTEVYLYDIDNDGDLDAFLQTYLSSNELWFNDGHANFIKGRQAIGNNESSTMAFADLDGDNNIDVFLTNLTMPEEVWINDGHGDFSNTGQALGELEKFENVVLSDFDNDGDIDAVVANSDHSLSVWLNDGKGIFKIKSSYPYQVRQLTAGDLDNDGDIDIYSSHRKSGDIIWLNDGKAGFTSTKWIVEKSLTSLFVDIDNDGDLDIILGKNEDQGGNSIYVNQIIN